MGYFKSTNTDIILDAEYAEFYVPMNYFDASSKFAEDYGQYIRVFAVFDVFFFKDGKIIDRKVMNIPTWTDVYVYDSETQSVELPGRTSPVQCKVLKFYKGNKIMPSTVVEDSTNAETYLGFVTQGKVPPSVPYDSSISLWRKNQTLNGVHLGVPSIISELILSVSYRDKNNLGQKFATVIGKDPEHVSQYDYNMASIRQICQYASTFSAMTFEDMDSMITTSLNRTRGKKPEATSPIEKIIKM